MAESDGLRKDAPDAKLKPWLRHAELAVGFLQHWEKRHWSDCALHNDPPGECDCRAYLVTDQAVTLEAECERLRFGLRYWRDQYIGATVDTAIARETWAGIVRAAFIEGYEKADLTSAPAHLAWEISDAFEAVAAQGMSASGQDREAGLEAKPASPVGDSRCAQDTSPNPGDSPNV